MNRVRATRQYGMTLIEIMVVVAIMAVLVTILVPSYRGYVERTNRTVGKAALSNLSARQESYAADHKTYTNSFARLGVSGTGTATIAFLDRQGNLSLASTSSALYRLAIHDTATAAGMASCTGLGSGTVRLSYVLVATPVNTRTDRGCGTLCLSSSGQRGATGGTETCWGR